MSPVPKPRTLRATGLACIRGRRLVFQGLDCTLEPNTVTWLRGANGSGKTSLLRILAGVSKPAAGDVLIDGDAPSRGAALAEGRIVYVGHANALKDDLTLAEAVAFQARLHGHDHGAASVYRALDRLGVAARHDAFVRTLSQGQRRRGALARLALDDEPRIWLLDEPLDALDVEGIACVLALIEAHARRGGSVLMTSHQSFAMPALRTFDLRAAGSS